MFKKLLIGLTAFLVLITSMLTLFAPPVHAQGTFWYNQTYEEWLEVVEGGDPDEIYGERYTAAQVRWVIYSLVYFLTTFDPAITDCLKENDGDLAKCADEIYAVVKELISSAEKETSLLASIGKRPISTIAYFKDIASRWHLIPEARAQQAGFGFGAASPMLGLWRMVRNVTYFLLILATIILSFMIMFRVRISPQVVITIQSALPKVIIALILITFSYAIAGFMIDLMYVVIGLLAGILSGSGMVGGTFTQWDTMFSALTERSVITHMLIYFWTFLLGLLAVFFTSGLEVFGIAAAITLIPGAQIIWLLIILIIAIVFLVALVRIIFLLVRTYVNVLLQVVFGPLMILMGTLGQGGVGRWLRNLAAQLAVYPAAGFMFFVAFVFLRGAFAGVESDSIPILGGFFGSILDAIFPFGIRQSFGTSSWVPPLTVGAGTKIEMMWLFASLAVLLLIPNISNMISSAISGRPFAYGTAIGAAIGPVFLGGGQLFATRAQQRYEAAQATRTMLARKKIPYEIPVWTARAQQLGDIFRTLSRQIR